MPKAKLRRHMPVLGKAQRDVGQRVYPAADLSEQISLAGKEASGTGNMKFAMNGALTIGTLDGANIEIREEVGEENFFLFGLTADEVQAVKSTGYNPRSFYDSNEELRSCVDSLVSGQFSLGDPDLFRPLHDSLLNRDEYMLLADYPSYIECQNRVSAAYRDRDRWNRMSILNVAVWARSPLTVPSGNTARTSGGLGRSRSNSIPESVKLGIAEVEPETWRSRRFFTVSGKSQFPIAVWRKLARFPPEAARREMTMGMLASVLRCCSTHGPPPFVSSLARNLLGGPEERHSTSAMSAAWSRL
jgi:Carbohydrate phosphorylase